MVAGGGVQPAAKGAVHGFRSAEAAGLGYLFHRGLRGFQESAGSLETERLDMVSGCARHLSLEQPAELPLREVDLTGQGGYREIVGEVVG